MRYMLNNFSTLIINLRSSILIKYKHIGISQCNVTTYTFYMCYKNKCDNLFIIYLHYHPNCSNLKTKYELIFTFQTYYFQSTQF